MNKEYRCICGKVFDNPQKFNGHKSSCKEHIQNKYQQKSSDYFQLKSDKCRKSGLLSALSNQSKQQQKLDAWILEQHKCEKCGKVMTEKYGSGRFCSRSCANSHTHSEQTKQKISQSNKSKYEYVNVNGNLLTVYQKTLLDKKLLEKECRQIDKFTQRQNQIADLDLANSPYKDFDTVYFNSGSYKDCYYFIRHDENGSIIERVIVPIYRYIIEYNLKRRLTYNEVVHHKDGNHHNNDINNLQIMTRSQHSSLHKNLQID